MYLIQIIDGIIRRNMVPPKRNCVLYLYHNTKSNLYIKYSLAYSNEYKKSSYPSLTIIVLKCLCTPDGVTLLLIIFRYMNKSVLTALVVMPAIAASSLVGVTFANSNSVDTSSVKNGFQKQIQGGLNHLK